MSGRYSRNKGYRNERKLVLELLAQNYKAQRVPLSGGTAFAKGDVVVDMPNGTRINIEVKSRAEAFKNLYDMYFAATKAAKNDLMCLALPHELCVDVSSSFSAVLEGDLLYELIGTHPLYSTYKRAFDRIVKLKALKQDADILAIRDDNKPFLFFRFR